MSGFKNLSSKEKDDKQVLRAAVTLLKSAKSMSLPEAEILSIKVAIPMEGDADRVAAAIEELHPDLKAHSKGHDERGRPILAIGYR